METAYIQDINVLPIYNPHVTKDVRTKVYILEVMGDKAIVWLPKILTDQTATVKLEDLN